MPTLNWIGKEAVIRHHKDVPYRLLEPVADLSCSPHPLADEEISPEAGSRKPEAGSRKPEAGSRKPEAGSRKPEAGSRKPEAGSRKPEAGSRKPISKNLIVQGDNLHALKALLPRYAGQVKCIYIDPPYNTGVDDRDEKGNRSGWIYNDNVNSPEISAWLGKVVGDAAEDLSRQDKWLCMMYPRLVLLKQFLRDDGMLFASIDENEYASLRFLLDEIFGVPNRIGTIIWKNVTDNNPTNIAVEHEYLLCYARMKPRLPKEWKSANLDVKTKLLEVGKEFIERHQDQAERQEQYTVWFRKHKDELWPFDRYKYIDDGGIYTGSQSVHNPGKEGYRYDVLHDKTGKPCQQPMMGYRFPPDTMQRLLAEKRVLFGEDETKLIELKVYAKDYRAKLSSLFELEGRAGTNEIKEFFPGNKRPFDFPKPTALIEELLSFTTSGNDLILDSFGGSGTTGHAVMRLNAADGGNRSFILVEMKAAIAQNITAERIKRVAQGYTNAKGEAVIGLGGGFQFCKLSAEPLFTADGAVRADVRFAELAEFVWFSETGIGLPPLPDPLPQGERENGAALEWVSGELSPLLGLHEGRAIYLLYNGILKDRSADGGNVLTAAVLADLPPHDGPKTIYAAACRLGTSRLNREGILFRQTPYSIGASIGAMS